MSSVIYAAIDGSWGEAAGIVMVDTAGWELVDFTLFDYIRDYDAPKLAQLLWDWNDDGRPATEAYFERFAYLGISEDWVMDNRERTGL